MNLLYTVAYPEIGAADREFIEAFRLEHDPSASAMIRAHFTLLFGTHAVAEADYLAHVATVAARTQTINFCCRYAMLGSDCHNETAYMFLVPEEGFSALSRLHDALYTGPLAPHLRLDVPYVPHITIGTLVSQEAAKQLCDSLNAGGVHIAGMVGELQVGTMQADGFQQLGSFKLKT
ncbi:2'-5' RNA ligase family protein [Marinobacterium arenosum]|uniref:2'-5' RNA ligase family protein n=1 Tax=Marinobacterium arenosum TaxID=2862496 RepID=UPI001C983A5E|nr:2'-5' RNA ligase family protein [Marinobacterium arenosum]MBY4678972.1 2'-5' RNA ligase family protein [Marinobacterium arenosum]